jgi:hypothetical protein
MRNHLVFSLNDEQGFCFSLCLPFVFIVFLKVLMTVWLIYSCILVTLPGNLAHVVGMKNEREIDQSCELREAKKMCL